MSDEFSLATTEVGLSFVSLRYEIEKSADIRELKDWRAKAEAIRSLVSKRRGGEQQANELTKSSVWTMRQEGGLLEDMRESGELTEQGQHTKVRSTDRTALSLEDLDVTKNESSACGMLWQVPEKLILDYFDKCEDAQKQITIKGAIDLAKQWRRAAVRLEKQNANPEAELPLTIQLENIDSRTGMERMDDDSIDLIFTDPPYDTESIPLYIDMARIAAQKLKVGGSLITYAGHYALPELLSGMCQHLRYWWIMALQHEGNSARLPGKWVFVGYKPLLWFVREKRRDNEYVSDCFKSRMPSKNEHEWQQDTSEAEYYIERLTSMGDLVVDPFAGSGTTLLAAHGLDRKSVGFEIDTARYSAALNRIADA